MWTLGIKLRQVLTLGSKNCYLVSHLAYPFLKKIILILWHVGASPAFMHVAAEVRRVWIPWTWSLQKVVNCHESARLKLRPL